MTDNREGWQPLLHQLAERTALAAAQGGPEKVARQHQRGRLTARERVAELLDAHSLNEVGALTGGNHPAGEPPLAGDGLVGGVPAIGGAEASRASAEEANTLRELQSGAWVPADNMAFDKVIDPRHLRNELISVLHRRLQLDRA